MTVNLRRAIWTAATAALLGVTPLWADEPQPLTPLTPESAPEAKPEAKPEGNREGRRSNDFLDRIGRYRAIDRNQRDHESIRVAFRDVVIEPHKATVRILCDDKAAALGSIVDPEGYILTKASELRGKLSVKLHDARLFDAQIIGIDIKTDLAMLKIDTKDLPIIAWRDGADVPSVGSLLASSSLETLPLAIGVVSVQPRLIAAPGGVMGVVLEDIDGLPRVAQIMSSSGAEKAGMQKGDGIKSVNGKEVKNRDELVEIVRQFQPGEKVDLLVKRGEEELSIQVTLGARPQDPEAERKNFQNTLGGPLSERRNGFPLALQHDTVLLPQDCGGPLVDLDGRCVGINIARAGRVNSYALPAAVVLPLVAEFKAGKFSPGPSADQIKLELTKRLDELRMSQTTLVTKLSQVAETIRNLQAATDANREELLKQAEAERAAAESELSKVKAELEKIESKKTSVEK